MYLNPSHPIIISKLKSENISFVGEQLKWTIKFIFESIIDDPTLQVLMQISVVNMVSKLESSIVV